MKEILPGIYQMSLTLSGFNPGSVNVYLIKNNTGYTCIDTGWDLPPSVQSMEDQLAEIGARISDINQAIITHCHIDHLGMICRFKHSHNIQYFLPEKELDLMKIRFTETDKFLPLTDQFLLDHGFPKNELTPPDFMLPMPVNLSKILPDVLVYGDEVINVGKYTLKVINAPGHTQGHIVLYEPNKKLLFSGDMLLPTINTNAAMHVQHIQYPLQKYLNSLTTLRALDINLVLPGHEFIFSGHRQRIDKIFRRHHKKSAEILRAFADRLPKTAYDISRCLARSARARTNTWDKLSSWDKRFAVLQTVAYLESLCFNHKAESSTYKGIHYYHLVEE
jgi:glyoxylase-like metal-dependent hydrolase (beta-lactamase superfamily II)